MTERGQVFGPGLQAGSTNQQAPTNPTGTTSTASVMMGLGGVCTLTPKVSTRVLVCIQGQITNTLSGDGAVTSINFGTGTAPANGAAFTGTGVGGSAQYNPASGPNVQVPFCCVGIVTGLSVGTTYWFDLVLAAITGGTASVLSLGFTAVEV